MEILSSSHFLPPSLRCGSWEPIGCSLAEEPRNTALLADALYEVTGRRLALAFALGEPEPGEEPARDEPEGEEAFLSLLRDELGAREVEE